MDYSSLNSINQADAIIISIGSEVDTESKLPYVIDDNSLWSIFKTLKEKKVSYSTVANPAAFVHNPQYIWSYLGFLYNQYKDSKPSKIYKELLKIIDKKDYFILTGNISNQLIKAGFDENRVYEINGNLNRFQCTECDATPWISSNELKFDIDLDLLKVEPMPKCPKCTEMARPNAKLFGDYSWKSNITDAQEAKFNGFMSKYDKGNSSIVLIELGVRNDRVQGSLKKINEFINENLQNVTYYKINKDLSDSSNGSIYFLNSPSKGLQELFTVNSKQ